MTQVDVTGSALGDRATAVGGTFGLGRVSQVSFAVEDFDRSLAFYEALFGPFRTWRAEVDGSTFSYRGVPTECTLQIGLARCGDVDIELIAVEAGSHPISDHIREHGSGLHHVAFVVDDLDAKRVELESSGFEMITEGSAGTGIRFCQFRVPALLGSTVVELMHVPSSVAAR